MENVLLGNFLTYNVVILKAKQYFWTSENFPLQNYINFLLKFVSILSSQNNISLKINFETSEII